MHGLLRKLLSQYTGVEPRELEFTSGPNGKPAVVGGANPRFSLSRSQNIVVFALALREDLGVDVEVIRPLDDFEGMVKRCLTAREGANLLRRCESGRLEAFFESWTCKEAYLKATGQGITDEMTGVEDSVDPDGGVRLSATPNAGDHPSGWSLYSLKPTSKSVGAVDIRGAGWRVKVHDSGKI